MNNLPDILKMPNNAFVDEFCNYCKRWFDACLDFIYENKIKKGRYYCYDCGKMIMREQRREKVILT
jgi:hypothetical protein